MAGVLAENLPFLSNEDRLKAYQWLTDGCSHTWSKNKLQLEKAQKILDFLIPLASDDPYFLAHLTSYALTKTQNKDLQVFLTYAASLSSANGQPFSPGSTYLKPNLRYISAAGTNLLDPKLIERVLTIASLKYAVANKLNLGRHFPNTLRTALEKYLTYRENNLNILKGVKKAGLGKTIKNMYRGLHKHPTDEAAAILRWQQKDHKVKFEDSLYKDFDKLTDLQIAEKIRAERLPILGVLGSFPRQVSPVLAVALLEQATGNQAVILTKTFEEAGVLKDPEVFALYEEKIKTAKTALDRVDVVSQQASEATKQALSEARSEVRKEATKGLGKIYLHLDFSGSMGAIKDFAIEKGAIFAECVNSPAENFRWGVFGGYGEELSLPTEFVCDAFAATLFGKTDMGSTDCFALYPNARNFGANVDVFVTDQGHNVGNLEDRIKLGHQENPETAKPTSCVIIDFGGMGLQGPVAQAYLNNQIPVAILNPNALTESALVVDAVKAAILGPTTIINEIMETSLLELPKWYFTI